MKNPVSFKSKTIAFIAMIAVILLFNQCSKDPLKPFDIFEEEELSENPKSILLSGLNGADNIFVNEARVIETNSGYHIKGTIFSESLSGVIPITSGDFEIVNDENGNTKSFSGYGTALFADVGLFSEIENEITSGGFFNYSLGSYFKSQKGGSDLPLLDERYYFGFKLDESEYGQKPSVMIKNTTFAFTNYYVDANDPAFFIKGDLAFANTKTGKTSAINNLGIGVSANGLFKFEPLKYSNRMEEVTGGTGFEEFQGSLYLTGEIPLKKYPITLFGEMVIDNKLSDNGVLDFFENGFDDASFQLGANGKILFDHELLKFLPVDLKIELAKATVQARFSADDSFIRFAGEYNQEDILKKILGAEALQYIQYYANEGRMYVSMGADKDDWKLYIETVMSMNIPGMGKTDLQETMLLISPSGIQIYAKMAMPYNINEVSFLGIINSDGTFLMNGQTTCDLDIYDNLQFYSHLELEVSNNGIFLSGSSNLPYGIGDVEINGEITLECISLGGMINSQIDFGQGVELPAANMSVQASSCEGISLHGELDVPYGISYVLVEGKLTAEEISLSGVFSSHINFGGDISMPALDMTLTASTLSGIYFKGILDVPYGIAHVGVEGSLNSYGIRLAGEFGTNIDFGNGFVLPALNMNFMASTVPTEGVTFAGQLTMPGTIGTIGVTGLVNINEIAFTGNLNSQIGINGFNFSNSFAVSVSSMNGGRIYGNIYLPGGLANVYVNGWYNPNGSFSLTGSESHNIDFGIIELGVGFAVTVASNQIAISASGHGCVLGVCYDPSVSVNPDWGAGSLELCIDIAGLGDACIGF